jgi:hypothetical protein
MTVTSLLVLASCSVRVEGGTTLALLAERDGIGPAVDTLHTTLGYRVRLDRLYLAIQAVQLVPASGSAARVPSWPRVGEWLLPSVAYAHTPGSPTRLGVPSVLALNAAPGTRWVLGDLAPPPATYPGARIILAPPDDDAQYLPTDVDMIDHTLHVDGMAFQGADSVAISLSIPIHDSVEVSVPQGNGSALVLRSRSPYQLRVKWDPQVWFDHIDFLHQPTAAWEDSIRSALPRSVSFELEAAPTSAATAPLAPMPRVSSRSR